MPRRFGPLTPIFDPKPRRGTPATAAQIGQIVTRARPSTITLPISIPTPTVEVPISPDDITGLAIWLDASDAATITHSSGAVSQWDDKSGNNRDLVPVDPGKKPTTGTRTLNGLNVLDFNDDTLQRASFWYGLGDSTMFVVVIADTSHGDATLSGVVMEYHQVSGSATDEYGLRFFGSTPRAEAIVYDQPTVAVQSLSTTSPYSAWHVWRIEDTTTNMKIFCDGSQEDSDNYTRPSLLADNFAVGGYHSVAGANNRELDGAIAEVIIYDSVLSSGDATLVENYLAGKWGL